MSASAAAGPTAGAGAGGDEKGLSTVLSKCEKPFCLVYDERCDNSVLMIDDHHIRRLYLPSAIAPQRVIDAVKFALSSTALNYGPLISLILGYTNRDGTFVVHPLDCSAVWLIEFLCNGWSVVAV